MARLLGMATTNAAGYELTGKQNMLLDLAAVVLIPWMASVMFGVFDLSLNLFGGYTFDEPVFSIGEFGISVALLVVVFGLVWILLTNELDGSDYEPTEFAVIAFAMLLPLLYVFVPAVESMVMWNDYSQFFFTLAVAVATAYISFTA